IDVLATFFLGGRIDGEITYADITINPATKKVRRQDINIFLTPKEFELLQYFMTHPNTTITKQELLSNIWDFDFETSTNVLEVYINFLRNKIDKDFREKLIHTLPRIGYIFKIQHEEQ
ncbi:MAG TPA: winged helix-turn-helix domain-containing protein, partial [Saprospiraceae bacterium]|nr:winged helix-turn-helix domain-containing protein [Saprospiraceae bacterium]